MSASDGGPAITAPVRFGDYVLLKRLHLGATTDVWVARPLFGTPEPVVIKRLHGGLAQDHEYVRRFRHEAQVAMALASPHVVEVVGTGSVGATLYIATAYVDGWSLKRIMRVLVSRGDSMPVSAAARVVADGLLGLAALHSSGDSSGALHAVHRDIAPRNLMLGKDGVTRLIDLGLGSSRWQDWRTRTGEIMGSPGYMAPEQVSASSVDARADLYAVGVVLYDLLTLEPYIPRGAIAEMLVASRAPTRRLPSQVRADVPEALDAVVDRALQLRPEDRFQSAASFRTALLNAVPKTLDAGPIDELVRGLMWSELESTRAEVSRLVAAEVPQVLIDVGPPPVPVLGISPGDRRAPRLLRAAVLVSLPVLTFGLGIFFGYRDQPPAPPIDRTPPPAAPAPLNGIGMACRYDPIGRRAAPAAVLLLGGVHTYERAFFPGEKTRSYPVF